MMDILLWPLSLLYRAGVYVNNKLFDWKILRSKEFDIPVVCVGNITVGGTGKTPMSEFLIERLSSHYNVALVSRGYRRRTSGFLEVFADTPFRDCGDEPKQIKLRFPEVAVAVCEDRAAGIDRIRQLHPEVNLIVLDDAFQHRRVEAWVNIVLMDYSRPIYHDHMLPMGRLRDLPSQLRRANFVVVTKCPREMTALDMRLVRKSLGLYPYQSLYFSQMENSPPAPLFPDVAPAGLRAGMPVVAMAGVARPAPLVSFLKQRYSVVGTLFFADHHPYRVRDLEKMQRLMDSSPEGTAIVTTEKDAVKLTNRRRIPERIQRSLYATRVRMEFIEDSQNDFLKKLYFNVRENQKYGLIHS